MCGYIVVKGNVDVLMVHFVRYGQNFCYLVKHLNNELTSLAECEEKLVLK